MRMIVLGALLAITGGLTGYGLYNRLFSEKAVINAVSSPIESPEKQDRSIPDRLPDITLANRDGRPTAIRSFDARILVVNFWATWCAPCRREIPLLRQLRAERGRSQGLEIVGVAVDFRDAVLAYADRIGLDYPLLIGEEDGLEALDAFGVPNAFPASVFVDREQRIVAVKLGELHADEAAFILDRVHDVNENKLDLSMAKQQIARKLQELASLRARQQAEGDAARVGSANPGH
ncbi:MAG: TlpA family protein disulfide reductase [Gemmataceae bacterium]|nr:TlpA family protein disulfide reductase [Gemmataceae bacterium]